MSTGQSNVIMPTVRISSRLLAQAHLVAIGLLALAHLITQWLRHVKGLDSVYGLVDFLDLANEGNLPTFFSTYQLLLCAAVLALIAGARLAERDRFRWHWVLLSALAFFLAGDEAAGLHELMIRPVQQLMPGVSTGLLYWGWVVPAMVGVLVVAVSFARFARLALPADIRWQLIIAAVIFLGGAIGVEMFEARYYQQFGQENMGYATYVLVEETCEMLGVLLALLALLRYWRREVGGVRLEAAA